MSKGYYKTKGGTFNIDFVIKGVRFQLPTALRNEREIKRLVEEKRETLKRDIKDGAFAASGEQPLTLRVAIDKYLEETCGKTAWYTEGYLNAMADFFGPTRLLKSITHADMLSLRAKKAKQEKYPGFPGHGLVNNSTVNKAAVHTPRTFFSWAKRSWGVVFTDEPRWRALALKEPAERIRHLSDEEAEVLVKTISGDDQDYLALFLFLLLTGLRKREATLLKWSEVDWGRMVITKFGKGGGRIYKVINPKVEEILRSRMGHDPVHVFTFVGRGKNKKRGQRFPIVTKGLDCWYRRVRRKAAKTCPSLLDKESRFRIHDARHHYATNLLRVTGNLKLVQTELGHSRIETTARYAHILEGDRRVHGALAESEILRQTQVELPRIESTAALIPENVQ